MIGILLFLLAQNVAEDAGVSKSAPPTRLGDGDLEALLEAGPVPRLPEKPESAFARVSARLSAHLLEFLDGFPYRPYQHTLGISGTETYFDHPDRMFYSLSLALPVLPPPDRERVRRFLKARLEGSPPYTVEGFEPSVGRARESYQVPKAQRARSRARARSAFGVYAFWAYARYGEDEEARSSHWGRIKDRIEPLLREEYRFDIQKTTYSDDEAEKLNGDLAGLIAMVRLARANQDAPMEKSARSRALALLELRVNLDRVNAHVLERTSSTSAHLHASKLARYCDLVEPVGRALDRYTEGCAALRLGGFRQSRPAWYLAYGDRMIGGENYTNPPHFSHALFSGAALVEGIEARRLLDWVDVPWCRGDFYFIEKCAQALWSAARVP
jgi:hypothetical protein